ncbi:hypothetical protein HMPREF2851_04025 [Actinomyces sp. HMSC064C12]|nr:hypothetical protein HMPREF2851_04025 [Actinomyces sp. HMSC064C12]
MPDAGWALFALAIIIFALAPGYFLARLFRVHGLQAAAMAPSLTFGMVGAASIVAPWLHLRWSFPVVASFLVAQILLLAAVRALVTHFGRRSLPTAHSRDSEALPYPARMALPATIGLAIAITLCQFARGLAKPTDPSQFWDGLFHINAIKVVQLYGNASPLGGLAPINPDGKVDFYPTLYHAFVAALTTKSTPLGLAISASAAGLIALGIITLTGLTHSLLTYSPQTPAKQLAIVATPLIAAGSLCLTQLGTVLSTLPYLCAMAATPGALGALNIAATRGTHWGFRAASALAALGVLICHPIGGFSLLLLCAPLVFGKALPLVWSRRKVLDPRIYTLIWILIALVVLGGIVGFFGPMFRVLSYYRAPTAPSKLAFSLLTDWPTMRRAVGGTSLYILTLALAALGCIWLVVNRINHWIVLSLALTCAFYFSCSSGMGLLRRLTSPWYMQPERLQTAFSVALMATAAIGIYAIGTWATTRGAPAKLLTCFALFCIAVTPFARAHERSELVALSYDPMRIGWGTFATRTELNSFAQIKQITGSAPVLSVPDSGVPFGYALAGVNSYYKHASTIGKTEWALFKKIAPLDSAACKFLRSQNIQYYYKDTDPTASGARRGRKRTKRTARLDQLIPEEKMTLVWKAASAPTGEGPRLYKISACY